MYGGYAIYFRNDFNLYNFIMTEFTPIEYAQLMGVVVFMAVLFAIGCVLSRWNDDFNNDKND